MTGRLLALALIWCGLALGQTTGVWVIGETGGGSGSGSGTVNTGTTPRLSFYPSTGTGVDDTERLEFDATNFGIQIKDAEGDVVARLNSNLSLFSADGLTENLRIVRDAARLQSGYTIRWSSTTAWNGTADAGICRPSAGVLNIYDGTTCTTLRDIAARSLLVGTSLLYEGTADDFETTVTFADPTADRAIVFPDAGGTVAIEAEVAAAIQTGQWIAIDGGSGTDAYTGTTTPCIEAIGTRLLVLFRPDVDNTGASTLTITGCSGDLGPYPIYDGEDAQATSDGQLKAGIDKWLTFCPTCNSAAGAFVGNFAATPPSATWGAIGGTLSDQTDLNDAIAAASIDNLGAIAPIVRTGDDYDCPTCVVEDGSGNVAISGDLTVTGDIIAGGGGALTFELTWLAGLNIGGSPSSGFSLPAANAPAVTAETGGTNSVQNTFFQFDDTTDESVYFSFVLPSDWTGAIDGKVYWRGVATTGEVTWGWQLACTDDAETLTQALNTASVVASTAKGTTLQMNEAVETGITATGCSAGDIIQGRFFRDANASEAGADDDFSGDAFFYSMTLTVRRQL